MNFQMITDALIRAKDDVKLLPVVPRLAMQCGKMNITFQSKVGTALEKDKNWTYNLQGEFGVIQNYILNFPLPPHFDITMYSLGHHTIGEYITAFAHEIGHCMDYLTTEQKDRLDLDSRFWTGSRAFSLFKEGKIKKLTSSQHRALMTNEENAWVQAMNLLHTYNMPESYWPVFFEMKAKALVTYAVIPHD